MSRLDRHVASIQNRLMLRLFLQNLAWSAGFLALAWWGEVLVDHLTRFHLPAGGTWFLVGVVICAGFSLAAAVYRRPTAHLAAVAIDQELGLKEKFSTALYVRSSADPFARAAVVDAEKCAEDVSLYKRFGPKYPRVATRSLLLFGGALLSMWLLPKMDIFGGNNPQSGLLASVVDPHQQQIEAKRELDLIAPLTRPSVSPEAVKLAQEAQNLLAHPENDTARTNASVATKMTDAADILKKVADTQARYRTAEKNEELLKEMEASKNDDGSPMSKVQNEVKSSNFDQASTDLAKAAEQFSKLTPQQQAAAVKQAQTLAAALDKAANNPAIQQQINNALQQLSNNPKMAQAMAKAVSAMAQGNPAAAQQLSTMAQQVMKQMNGAQGATPQQQQMIQKMMAGIQAKAMSQAQAQAMAQSAQQMAQAMAQSSNAQQGTNQAPGKGQQAVANAQKDLQKSLQQMQAAQQDAQAMAAAQQAAQQAANQAANAAGQGQNPGQNPGQGQGQNPGQGQPNPGQGQGQQAQANGQGGQGNNQPQQGNNPNGQGMGAAGWAPRGVSEAPGQFEKEYDPTQDQGKGQMLASRLVHSDIDPGVRKAELQKIAASVEQSDSSDMDEDQIPKEDQKAVKDYYDKLQQQ